MSVFVIYIETTIYLLLHNLSECTFNNKKKNQKKNIDLLKSITQSLLPKCSSSAKYLKHSLYKNEKNGLY